jgi:hypothetical protein
MNYLIFTPDGVGSTLLQRLITMTLYLEKHNVQNTHELVNGLELDNGIAVKNFELKYSQSLGEIANILRNSQAQTTLVSRLAKYHLDDRNDPADDRQDFYKFLNGHFERKIMCVRENIFEYAMSWSIRDRSGVLNVYGKEDRDKVSQVSEVDESYFIKKCQDYVSCQNWVETNFPNIQKISYEDMLTNSDSIMETLTGYENTFKNHFGITLNSIIKKEYSFLQSASDLSNEEARGLIRYRLTSKDMINKGIIFSLPLKNTTLTDKKKQIKNFNSCLDKFYMFARNHNWIDQSNATYDFWNDEHIC